MQELHITYINISATDDHVLYIHMSQLAEVAPVGQDTTTKLLRPFVVAGH